MVLRRAISILLAVLLALSSWWVVPSESGASAAEGVSLLPNSGLETLNPNNPSLPLGFFAFGQLGVTVNVASVTEEVYGGERAALVSGRTLPGTGIQTHIQQAVAVHGPGVYTVGAYMKLADAPGGSAGGRIGMKIVASDNTTIRDEVVRNNVPITEAWTYIEAELDLQELDIATVKNVQIYFNTASLDSYYFDEVFLTKKSEQPDEEEPEVGGRTFYVSESGGDDATGDGTQDHPWRTIQKAADAVIAGDTVIIRQGIYREMVVPAESGIEGHPITFRAAPGEEVVISGTDAVSGWTFEAGNVYRAEAIMELGHENQVFVDGKMVLEARWPDAGGASLDRLLEFETATMDVNTSPTRIRDAELPDWDWSGASVWVSSDHRWLSWTGRVTGFGAGYLDIENRADAAGNHLAKEGGSYYVFGARAALDAEGEWFYDGEYLYLWAPGGGNPEGRVEAKRRTYAFDLADKAHIHIEGIGVRGATIRYSPNSEHTVLDGLHMKYIYHSNRAIEEYRSQLGTGLHILGSDHTIRNSEIAYGSGSGIVLTGDRNRVINNYIHDFNYIGSYASPLIFDGKQNLVSHNTIWRAGRSLVGRGNTNGGFYDSLLQYNDLGYGGYLTADLGLLYFNGQDGGNSEIRWNWLHDNYAPYNQHGLHFDHGTKNMIVHRNVVWGVDGNAFRNNMHTNYVLWLHNTGTTSGPNGFGSNWAAGMAEDQHGSLWVNNLTNGGMSIDGEGGTIYNNGLHAAELIDSKYISPGAAAVDAAVRLEGVNDTYAGSMPDLGAYELGMPPWTAGHSFEHPPADVPTERILPLDRNRIVNASFEAGTLSPWTADGTAVALNQLATFQWDVDKTTLLGRFSARLGAGTNEIYQVIAGLEPNTSYELMGKFRIDAGETACIGVRDYGGEELCSETAADTNGLWVKRTVTFTTGPSATSATVFAKKTSAGGGSIYVEDTGLQRIDPLHAAILEAENRLSAEQGRMPQPVLDGLSSLLTEARGVFEDQETTASAKEAATAALRGAIETFREKAGLLDSIEEAQQKLAEAVEGTAPGQYPEGAKAALSAAVAVAQSIVEALEAANEDIRQTKEMLGEALSSFEQSMNKTALGDLKAADLDAAFASLAEWSSQVNVEALEDGSLRFQAVNKYLGERYRNERFDFDFSYSFNGKSREWPGFVLRSQKEASSLLWQSADTAYLFVLKPNQWELQRFVDGAGGIIALADNSQVVGSGETHRFRMGSEDMESGVRLYLYVDGARVFDIVDSEAPIRLEGYFGIHNGPDTDAVTIWGVDGDDPGPGPGPGPGSEEDDDSESSSAGSGSGPGSEGLRSSEASSRGDAPSVGLGVAREVSANGTKTDAAVFDAGSASALAAEAKQAGQFAVRIVLTESAEDPADELTVELPLSSIYAIAEEGLELFVAIGEVELSLRPESLRTLGAREEPVTIRVIPVRDEAQRRAAADRAANDPLVRSFGGAGGVVLSEPIIIETNYDGVATRLRMPVVPKRSDEGGRMAVFIEHSDGEKALAEGAYVTDLSGRPLAIEIVVEKFSTFTVVQADRELVRAASYEAYVQGYPDGRFAPERAVSRAELAMMLASLLRADAGGGADFPDVDRGHWAYEPIGAAQRAGLLLGDANGGFRPDAPVSRAELAIAVGRWKRLKSDADSASSADTADHWAESMIASVHDAGIMIGRTEERFAPDDDVTRAEAVRVLNRLFGRPGLELRTAAWPDVPASYWAGTEIESAASSFIVREYSDGTKEIETRNAAEPILTRGNAR